MRELKHKKDQALQLVNSGPKFESCDLSAWLRILSDELAPKPMLSHYAVMGTIGACITGTPN